MATNSYFNNYFAPNEQDLVESMVIESIKIKGLDVIYIKRIQDNMDYLFKEDSNNIFNEGFEIEMYPTFVTGFDGDGELFSRFGLENIKTGTFVVSKKRFAEEDVDMIRPREGDLIYMPITNAFLEIKFVNAESPFFEKGKQYLWELNTETVTYSHEDYNLTDQDALDALDVMDLESLINPSGDEYIYTDDDEFADNNDLETDANDLIVTNPSNPFRAK